MGGETPHKRGQGRSPGGGVGGRAPASRVQGLQAPVGVEGAKPPENFDVFTVILTIRECLKSGNEKATQKKTKLKTRVF